VKRINQLIDGALDMATRVKLERSTGGDFKPTFSDVIQAGTYDAEFLDYQECEVEDYHEKGKYNPGIAFDFTIKLPDGDTVTVCREVAAKISKSGNKSNLYRMAVGFYGDELPDDICLDDSKFYDVIDQALGKTFSLTCSLETSKLGTKYNKWMSIMQKVAPGKVVIEDAPQETAQVDEDDIPF